MAQKIASRWFEQTQPAGAHVLLTERAYKKEIDLMLLEPERPGRFAITTNMALKLAVYVTDQNTAFELKMRFPGTVLRVEDHTLGKWRPLAETD